MAKPSPAAATEDSSSHHDDSSLDDFFENLEKLHISENGSENVKESNEQKVPASAVTIAANPSRGRKSQRALDEKELLNRAEKNKKSWKEFSSSSRQNRDEGRPKISFELRNKKRDNKKKSNSKTPVSLVAPPIAKPRWILVIDTCALLESFDEIHGLIATAVSATLQLEPITIVVPYKVWSELDFQSKDTQDENRQWRARRAIRLLDKNLRHHGGSHSNDAAIQSQSRSDMDKAAVEFLTERVDQANNDDHILFCARLEQKRHPVDEVGGVVLLTLDQVLSGKARADGVQVYTPAEFLNYYGRREASLRDRKKEENMDAKLWIQCYGDGRG